MKMLWPMYLGTGAGSHGLSYPSIVTDEEDLLVIREELAVGAVKGTSSARSFKMAVASLLLRS